MIVECDPVIRTELTYLLENENDQALPVTDFETIPEQVRSTCPDLRLCYFNQSLDLFLDAEYNVCGYPWETVIDMEDKNFFVGQQRILSQKSSLLLYFDLIFTMQGSPEYSSLKSNNPSIHDIIRRSPHAM